MPSAVNGAPPLVGRVAELAVLRQVIVNTSHRGSIAVVEGEAGIGKTRLVEAAIDVAGDAGMKVLSSRAEELEAHRPFSAIADCLGRELLDDDLGADQLAPDVVADRAFRIAERVLEVLDVSSARCAVLVVVEDLQWADPSTLAVLARVAAGIERLPVALLLTARPIPRRSELERLFAVVAARGATWVRLGPLDDTACLELAESLLDAQPGQRLVDQVRRATGNPLFVRELVDALLAAGVVVRRGRTAELEAETATPSLPMTILHRLSFAPPDVLDLMGLAAVLGSTFTVDDLALLAGRSVAELRPALRSAQLAGVLGDHGERLAFRHELVRDALYEDMPLAVRRALHGDLAEALADAGESVERRVEHVVRAAAPGDELAIGSLIACARELSARAPGAAVDVYRHAVELSVLPDARRAAILPELAEAMVSAGLLAEGEAACREALANDPEPHVMGPLRLRLMFLLMRRARTADAVAEGRVGLADPRIVGSDRGRLAALVSMAQVFSGDVEPAVRTARALLASTDDPLARAIVTNTLAWGAAGRGRWVEAAEVIAPNVRWAERSGSGAAHDTRPHLILGPVLVCLDRLDEAYATTQRGRHGAEMLGMVDQLAVYHFQTGFVHYVRGELDDALAELATHAQLAVETGIGWRVPAHSTHALIALHRDDLLAAERHLAAAVEDASGTSPHGNDLLIKARARWVEATDPAATELDTLLDSFEELAASGTATLLPILGPELARLAADAGRPQRAAGVVAELQRIAVLNPGVCSIEAAALHAVGLVESDVDAILSGLALLRGTGRRLEIARAAEDAAALGGDAGELLEEARQIYERCGATRDLARVDAALRRLGVRRGAVGQRRRPSTGWEALTDTELTVVRLVAERLSNPEIAARMFISRRTVQTHVSHALGKLGVATRRELAAEAARRAGWRIRVEGVGEDTQ